MCVIFLLYILSINFIMLYIFLYIFFLVFMHIFWYPKYTRFTHRIGHVWRYWFLQYVFPKFVSNFLWDGKWFLSQKGLKTYKKWLKSPKTLQRLNDDSSSRIWKFLNQIFFIIYKSSGSELYNLLPLLLANNAHFTHRITVLWRYWFLQYVFQFVSTFSKWGKMALKMHNSWGIALVIWDTT